VYLCLYLLLYEISFLSQKAFIYNDIIVLYTNSLYCEFDSLLQTVNVEACKLMLYFIGYYVVKYGT